MLSIIVGLTLSQDYHNGKAPLSDEILDLSKSVGVKRSPSLVGRKLAETEEFRDFRIALDTEAADAFVKGKPDLEKKLAFSVKLIKTAMDYFKDRFKVKSAEETNYSSLNTCHGVKVSNDIKKVLKADYVIVIRPFNQSSGWFMAAGACAAGANSRPVAGAVYLNFQHINVTERNEFMLPPIFIHEILHAVGFSGYFFQKKGVAATVNQGGANVFAFTGPKVLQYAKDYYKCDLIKGVP